MTILTRGLWAAIGLACCGAAHASTTIYTDEVAFFAAHSQVSQHFFTGDFRDGSEEVGVSNPYRFAGATFTSPDSLTIFNDYGTYLDGPGPTLTMETHFQVLGVYYGSYYDQPVTVYLDGVAVAHSAELSSHSASFVGFADRDYVRHLSFSVPGNGIYEDVSVDSFVTASAVPEPAAWSLLLAGFAVTGVASRSVRRASQGTAGSRATAG